MTLLNNWLASLPFMTAERADYVISSFWPMMEGAILYTIPLAVISFFCGLFIAVIVAVICTLPHPNLMTKILQGICRTYISIIRGTPMLVQIFIIFYGLPEVGIKLEPFPTAIIAFSINIGAYAAAMNGVDIIVWTAGVGENQEGVRWDSLQDMEYLGVKMDKERNHVRGKEQILSADDSKVKVVMIPTDEEIVIARDTMDIVKDLKK